LYKLELVLRKWFVIDPSREMRAFVREGVLIGISQRGDTNYYEFLNEPGTQRKIVSSFVEYWMANVKPKWTGPTSCKLLLLRIASRFALCVIARSIIGMPCSLLCSLLFNRYA